MKGRILWQGLLCADKNALVPFEGNDPKTGFPYCSIEALQEVVREGEAYIDKSNLDRPEISKEEFNLKHVAPAASSASSAPPPSIPPSAPVEEPDPRFSSEAVVEELDQDVPF